MFGFPLINARYAMVNSLIIKLIVSFFDIYENLSLDAQIFVALTLWIVATLLPLAVTRIMRKFYRLKSIERAADYKKEERFNPEWMDYGKWIE